VIARRRANEPSVELSEGVRIHRVGNPFTLKALTKLRELTKDRSPAVIHTHSTTGAFLAATKRIVRTPIVSHIHGTTYSVAAPAVLAFGGMKVGYSRWGVTTSYLREKALWGAADRLAAVSSSVKSDLKRRYGIGDDKV